MDMRWRIPIWPGSPFVMRGGRTAVLLQPYGVGKPLGMAVRQLTYSWLRVPPPQQPRPDRRPRLRTGHDRGPTRPQGPADADPTPGRGGPQAACQAAADPS